MNMGNRIDTLIYQPLECGTLIRDWATFYVNQGADLQRHTDPEKVALVLGEMFFQGWKLKLKALTVDTDEHGHLTTGVTFEWYGPKGAALDTEFAERFHTIYDNGAYQFFKDPIY